MAKNILLKYFLKNMCPDGMKIPLNYAIHFLHRKGKLTFFFHFPQENISENIYFNYN